MEGISPPFLLKELLLKLINIIDIILRYQIETKGIKMKLTPRERDVITLVAEGFADKEIGEKLSLSPRTIQTHMKSVILKYNARNRTNAVALYIKSKYKRKR